jgi:outer membrane receptor protein involved in Fe transport
MKKIWVTVVCLCLLPDAFAQTPPTGPSQSQNGMNAAVLIEGVVKSGNRPLPGVNIVIGDSNGRKVVTSTDVDGTFSAVMPGEGRWVIRAELAAFSSATKEVTLDSSHTSARVEMQLTLRSAAVAPQQPGQMVGSRAGAEGFQRLNVMEQAGAASLANGASEAPLAGIPALAMSDDAATESVAVTGAMGSTNDFARSFEELRERVQAMRERGEFPPGGPMGGHGGPLGGPGMGPMGAGPFVFRGPGGPGGRPRFNVNQPHGSLFYSAGNSALDAAPYSLSGQPEKPDYGSSRFGGVLGGPLRIPKLFDAGPKTFFFLSIFGTRATTPYDVFSHVPTQLEREGDFSQTVVTHGASATPVQILYPGVVNNVIPQNLISPQAQALLKFIPLPNAPGEQNFRYSTAAGDNGTNIGFRLIHNFGAPQSGRRGLGFRSRNNINFAFNYSAKSGDLLQPFPGLGGKISTRGLNLQAGYSLARGRWTNQLRFTFNQQNADQHNLFADVQNVAGIAGIQGTSANPADWGVPGLSFSHYSNLTNVAPRARRDRVFQWMDTAIWTRGQHSVRVGGDFRRMLTRLYSAPDPNGTFTFNGFATGYDFADFLLGLPLQTTIQYSPYTYRFAANGYDLFVQDSWRVRSNLTFELGLRYEYVSPYSEVANRIVNLSLAPGLASVTPITPADSAYPGLIKPDRNNFAPRIGVAWKPLSNMVVRAGYGINYNVGQYKLMVQQLALQPQPAIGAFAQTTTATAPGSLSLALIPQPHPGTVTNNYGVDPNYRLGYVQLWNLDLQYELMPTLVVNAGYNGSKGTALDIVEAPNRGPNGTLIPSVQPFLWETSAGASILHAGTLRVRKRMSRGLSVGGSYTFSKSIDNASSIGGGAVVVAQNPLDLAAERGLSSFDVRHKLTGDFLYELPFGTGKKWLETGTLGKILGDWTWSGTFTIQSGSPWTARVLGNTTDVAGGANGSLRADVTGQPIQLPSPTVQEWFNTAAFTLPPSGQFGNAGRNTIIGPGLINFDMAMSKNFPIREMMAMEVRVSASNIFNTPHFTAIDTVVNSPTFGHVISAGPMRSLQMMARFRF